MPPSDDQAGDDDPDAADETPGDGDVHGDDVHSPENATAATGGATRTARGGDAADADGDTDANEGESPREEYGPTEGPSGREVVVPARLYKTVTVMSTLLAMVSVVGGFVALDAATNRARASAGEVDPLLALLGLGLIVGGAAAYAFATRFRAAGMGGDDEDEPEAGTDAAGEGTAR